MMKTTCIFVILFAFSLTVGTSALCDTVTVDDCSSTQQFKDLFECCADPVEEFLVSYFYEGGGIAQCDLYNCTLIGYDGGEIELTSDFCSEAGSDINSCMTQYYVTDGGCSSSDIEMDIVTFIGQFCDVSDSVTTVSGLSGSSIKSEVRAYEQQGETSRSTVESLSCYSSTVGTLLDEMESNTGSCAYSDPTAAATASSQVFSLIAREIDESVTCFIDELASAGCSASTLSSFVPFFLDFYVQCVFPGVNLDLDGMLAKLTGENEAMCSAESRHRKTLAVFGDPHLLTYNRRSSYNFQTCDLASGTENDGSTLYLSNDYFRFFGTNEQVCDVISAANCDGTSSATVMSDVTINFLGATGSIDATFSADSIVSMTTAKTNFEAAIADVSTLSITQGANSETVTIEDARSCTAISIAEIDNSYTVVLRLSRRLIGQSTGILKTGCSESETIDMDAAVARRRRRKRTASCDSANFASTCEYDFSVTQSDTFAEGVEDSVETQQGDVESRDGVFAATAESGATTVTSSIVSSVLVLLLIIL